MLTHVILALEVLLINGVDILDLLQVAGIRTRAQDQSDPAAGLRPSATHETARRVVEDGTDVDLDVGLSGDGVPQQLADVLTLHTGAAETLCPLDQLGTGQTLLGTGEGEGEPERQLLVRDVSIVGKVAEALRDVVEQLFSTPYKHNRHCHIVANDKIVPIPNWCCCILVGIKNGYSLFSLMFSQTEII